MKKTREMIAIMAVIIIILIGYVAITIYEDARQERDKKNINEGIQIGYNLVFGQLMNQLESCNAIGISDGTGRIMYVRDTDCPDEIN